MHLAIDAAPEFLASPRRSDNHLLSAVANVLFFELLPAFMAVVALVAGIVLFLMDREARHNDAGSNSEGDG